MEAPAFSAGHPLEVVDGQRTGDVAQILREQDDQGDGPTPTDAIADVFDIKWSPKGRNRRLPGSDAPVFANQIAGRRKKRHADHGDGRCDGQRRDVA